MRLKQIYEGYASQKMREMGNTDLFFQRPSVQLSSLYRPEAGQSSSATVAGSTSYPTGVPKDIRKRQYLGLSRRPGTIRL